MFPQRSYDGPSRIGNYSVVRGSHGVFHLGHLSMRFRIKQIGRHTFRPVLPLEFWRKVLNSRPATRR
jgi:hypothetical protein